ncbi:MAG: RluA family pseudouridine synthase [Clostridia bacterium]|nr:RluA family pseudouridine synthase [Clostridia bacterium]
MKQITLNVGDNTGERLDKFIGDSIDDITRNAAQKLIADGNVAVNGAGAAKNYKTREGDLITVTLPDPKELSILPQDIKLCIIYEDDCLLVVNKPKGMVVHPAPGNYDGTLVNALLHHCRGSLSGINGVIRPGIVHRIDKDTSGLLMVAKNDSAHLSLSEQIKEHSFKRQYDAVVYGVVKNDCGKIDLPIGRHPIDRKKMTVTDKNSREAVTLYEVVRRYEGFTHVRLTLQTGRTHQIRVHMAHIGHPVAGDPVYGPKKVITQLCGQCLNATVLGFVHPETKEYMEFNSGLPDYFTDFLNRLKPLE